MLANIHFCTMKCNECMNIPIFNLNFRCDQNAIIFNIVFLIITKLLLQLTNV